MIMIQLIYFTTDSSAISIANIKINMKQKYRSSVRGGPRRFFAGVSEDSTGTEKSAIISSAAEYDAAGAEKVKRMTDIENFRENLLLWYKENSRALPWRKDRDPYKILISELMLQQTGAETAIPYFIRFTGEIPDIHALAAADDGRLLKLWQGLGYYGRALRLGKAARLIVSEYGGRIPSSLTGLLSLPGVGPYTAGAVASIAFGLPVPAVDGNVLRIAARLTASREDIAGPKAKKQAEELIGLLISPDSPGDFNQALMDLGALVCLPGAFPACKRCPVGFACEAYRLGIAGVIPVRSRKKARGTEERTVLVVSADGRYALRKRKETGLLAGLWEFPNLAGSLTKEQCRDYLLSLGLTFGEIKPLGTAKHVFSHLEWEMTGYLAVAGKTADISGWVWASAEEIRLRYSVPSAFKSYLSLIP